MSAPTGEVVNYETALAEYDNQIRQAQLHIDAAEAALAAQAEAKASVEAMQATYGADAAAATLDSETALNLDGTTVAHSGDVVDSLPVGAVDTLYDATEAIEGHIQTRKAQAEAALASLEAKRAHLIATYGDAHATVAGNLGGDSRFLDSGGGTGGGQDYAMTPSGIGLNPDRIPAN